MPVNECPSPPSGTRWTQRKAPFGRKSISQMARGTPLGSHHCATCSAFVQASKTTARGASKMRVITISRSLGVAIFTVPMFFIADLPLSLRASTCFLLLLHLFQVVVQAGKFLFPETAEGFKPLSDILEWDRNEHARTPLSIARTHNQAGSFEYVEVFGDRRLTEDERLHKLGDIRVSQHETGEDRASCGICERGEGQAQTVGG